MHFWAASTEEWNMVGCVLLYAEPGWIASFLNTHTDFNSPSTVLPVSVYSDLKRSKMVVPLEAIFVFLPPLVPETIPVLSEVQSLEAQLLLLWW